MEEKLAFGLEDVPREVWGGLAGGVLGGLAGHGFSSPETKKRNAILGALAGAGVGATGARLLGRPDSAPAVSNKQLEVPGPETARPSRPEPGKLTAQAVEPVLQQSEARTQQAVQQQAVQQALQLSSARERAAIVRDQGQVAARMQALLAPRAASPAGAAPPSPPPSPPSSGGGPHNIVIAPGGKALFSRVPYRVAERSGIRAAPMAKTRTKMGALEVDEAQMRDLLVQHPLMAMRLRQMGRSS